MSTAATWRAWRALQRSARLDEDALRRLREERLRRLVLHAARHVPFWRRRFDDAGVDPASVRCEEDLRRLPVTTKAELIEVGPAAVTSGAYAPSDLREERTSGSTGRPFTLRYDRAFAAVRRGLFLRALGAAGWRPWRRLLLVTTRRPPPRVLPWRYAAFDDSPALLAEEMRRFRPDVVYGWVTPLRRLAETGGIPYRPRAVVTTAESLDPKTRASLAAAFGAPVFDAYGLTETGFLAWECGAHAGSHLSEDTTIVETLASDAGGGARRLVVTNLALTATPLLRYDTGDLVARGPAGPCACGRTLRRIGRVEGRAVDCLRLPDGRTVPPYRLTLALERVPGLARYQVVQEAPADVTVRFETDADASAVSSRIRAGLGPVLGPHVRIHPKPDARIAPAPGRKFRVVECRLQPAPTVRGR